jgi:phospholipase C
MPYTVEHLLAVHSEPTVIRTSNGQATARFSHSGPIAVGFPGRLEVAAVAGYVLQMKLDRDDGRPARWESHRKTVRLKTEVRTPDGALFSRDDISLDDIRRFRDLRGVSHGTWTYQVTGESEPVTTDEGEARLQPGMGYLKVAVTEAVQSTSANPLVSSNVAARQGRGFGFDLWRVGTFVAATRSTDDGRRGRARTMRLKDPDGNTVAESSSGDLTYPVTLQTLDRSRGADGVSRPWKLEVARPQQSRLDSQEVSVWASVVQAARIGTLPLTERIEELIGKHGSQLKIYAELADDSVIVRLEVLDETSAALIDRYKLLKHVLKKAPQEPEVEPDDIVVGKKYNLVKKPQEFSGLKVWVFGMKVGAIDIQIAESSQIQPPAPALKIGIEVEGSAKIEYKGIGLANAKIRNGRIDAEVALRLESNGSFSVASWMSEDVVDIDVANDALLLAIGAGLVLGGTAPTLFAVTEFIEDELTDWVEEAVKNVLDAAGAQVPPVLAMVLGDDFTYRSLRFEGTDVVFDYAAPLEPDPKPAENYQGIIGRSATQLGPEAWMIRPPTLGNTWAADNLRQKIGHIVMVMMENRSFDHVLGYIAAQRGAGSDGLTPELVQFLEAKGFPVPKLSDSGIPPNGVQLKTKFPAHVGHSLADVTQQLSERIAPEGGRSVNSPNGFRENFKDKLRSGHEGQITVDHVLGWHDAVDLPFFKYLTDNYAYCERYFCSHAGPTLPNRMFSITGDVQYDRTSEAILDNNKGENFALSRAASVFDVLTRKGVPWRVYESFPSVAMLRMFARYATDTTNIVDITRLAADVAAGTLPEVTYVEPAMHHDPQNDDHPIADMYRGQLFLEGVYRALRANPAVWARTLLIITYDEHGGFYDHVIPPVADVRTRPLVLTDGGAPGTGHFTPDTIITPYGVRVPTFVVSPWVRPGKGPDIVLDHCSILKTILARFCGEGAPFLSDRVRFSRSLEAYLTETGPRDVPLPEPLRTLPAAEPIRRSPAIVTAPLFSRTMREGNVDFHDMTGMLARMLGRGSAHPVA